MSRQQTCRIYGSSPDSLRRQQQMMFLQPIDLRLLTLFLAGQACLCMSQEKERKDGF